MTKAGGGRLNDSTNRNEAGQVFENNVDIMQLVTQLLLAIQIVSFMTTLGLELSPRRLADVFRSPTPLLRGLLLGLVLIPMAAALCARWFPLSDPLVVGLIVLAVSPGVPFSAPLAAKRGGNGSLALVLVFLFGAIAPLTAPAFAQWLLSYEANLDFHPARVIGKLAVLQWLPLALGMSIGRWRPTVATRLARPLTLLSTAAMAGIVLVVLIPRLASLAVLGGWGLAAMVLARLLALGMARVLGAGNQSLVRTLEAVTAVPNVGLALLLVTSAGGRPETLTAILGLFLVSVVMNLADGALRRHKEAAPLPSPPSGEWAR